jgi:hypothetical protein
MEILPTAGAFTAPFVDITEDLAVLVVFAPPENTAT